MTLRLESGLLFVTATVEHYGKSVTFERVILDTGSAGTVFSLEDLRDAGIVAGMEAEVRDVVGVGGSERVVLDIVDSVSLGEGLTATDFRIEYGGMDYGFPLDGIIGLDFLMQVKAVLNLETLELTAPARGV